MPDHQAEPSNSCSKTHSEDLLRGTFHGYDVIRAELVAVEGSTTNEKKVTSCRGKKEPWKSLLPRKFERSQPGRERELVNWK